MSASSTVPREAPDPAFEALLEYIKESRRFDFRGYKRSSLVRRVRKRMLEVGVESFEAYRDRLEVDADEFAPLFNTILINVTSFYRDPAAWEVLAAKVLPQLLAVKQEGAPIRVWSAACASGEEPYTAAIVLAEALGPRAFRERVKIYATDVDEEALDWARHATYPATALEPVRRELRERYFEKAGGGYAFRPDLRRSVIFGRHDLVQDAPISHLDLLICRNTLMYFDAESQGRILARFHYALEDTGVLFAGRAEMLLSRTALFVPLDSSARLFRKADRLGAEERLRVLAVGVEEANLRVARHARLREATLEAAPLPQVAVDAGGRLAFANRAARELFGLSPRDLDIPFHDLALSYNPTELRPPIQQAMAERRLVRLQAVQRRLPDGAAQVLDIEVLPLLGPDDSVEGVGLTFLDVTDQGRLEEELRRANEERETANEELQSANEELETTNEELQSTVEELETTNEELQATNEEMETMNEELQATNEELQAANDELRARSEDLAHANAFLGSILTGVNLGVAAVDRDLRILTWNRMAEVLWGFRAEEVVGAFFLSLDIGLPVERLKGALKGVAAGEEDYREKVLSAVNRRGRQIECRVTVTPLSNARSERSGAILLMEEWKGKGQEELPDRGEEGS